MTFDDIIGDLGNDPTGPQEGMKKDLILKALQDLCRKTFAYSELFAFLSTAGTYEHTLTPSVSNTSVIGVLPNSARIATVNSPVPSAAAGTDAGVLVSGTTYYYKVTACCDDYRETLPSSVCSAKADANGSIDISWSAIENADSYKVYGRTDGNWLYMAEVTSGVAYTDDGSDTPAGAIPTKSPLMRDIKLVNEAFLQTFNRYWRGYESDNVTGVIYDGKTTLALNRIPVTTGIGFQVQQVLYPTGVIDIPTVLESYVSAITDFVKWRLYVMPPSKTITWSNIDLGLQYRKDYFRQMFELRGKVVRSFGGEHRVTPQFFC